MDDQGFVFGFLNCNKPAGMTSRDVVNIVQRRIRAARTKGDPKIKVGHCGTLDPLAEGVLVLGVGPAVRLVPYVQQQPKHYIGEFRLGASSETGDLENGFTEHPELPQPTEADLQSACKQLVGLIDQIPPAYSAIWIDGERAYDRVRRGEDVEMPVRQVMIHSIELIEFAPPLIKLDIVCGSGTYIRSVGIDLAGSVGSAAVMTHLDRVGIGDFKVADALSMDQLRDDDLSKHLVNPTIAIKQLGSLCLDESAVARVQNGLCVEGDVEGEPDSNGEVSGISQSGQLVAIMRRKTRGWCPVRVFPVES